MTRETRIALLVGLAIIILFGLVLGQRGMKIAPVSGEDLPMDPIPAPGPEVRTAQLDETNHPVLSPRPAVRRVPVVTPSPVERRRSPLARDLMPAPVIRPAVGPAPARATPAAPAPIRPAPRPVSPATPRTYTVRAGDSLIAIARTVYGRDHGNEYMRIYQANRDRMRDESTVRPGQVLVIPPLAAAPRVAVTPAPAAPAAPRRHYRTVTLEALRAEVATPRRVRTYTIQPGDNLSIIAREQMGDGSRQAVAKLFQANRDRLADPDSLRVGATLRIPQ